MAREFCVTCRAESVMSNYRSITFMGRLWTPADRDDEEHY